MGKVQKKPAKKTPKELPYNDKVSSLPKCYMTVYHIYNKDPRHVLDILDKRNEKITTRCR